MKYYKDGTPVNTYVSSRCLDENGLVVPDSECRNFQCFSNITYNPIPKNTRFIEFFRELGTIPYTAASIKRWAKHVNDMGFPRKIQLLDKEQVVFRLDVRDYKWKIHLNATLMLLRCLCERGICKVPEIYFNLLAKDPKLDRFDAMQTAHKSINHEEDYPNTNHMVCCKEYNGMDNVSFKTLMERYENTGVLVFDEKPYRSIGQTPLWTP